MKIREVKKANWSRIKAAPAQCASAAGDGLDKPPC